MPRIRSYTPLQVFSLYGVKGGIAERWTLRMLNGLWYVVVIVVVMRAAVLPRHHISPLKEAHRRSLD